MITADMVKPGAVVIDVGINRMDDGKLCGDVDFESVKSVASAMTPVPGCWSNDYYDAITQYLRSCGKTLN